MNRTGLIEALVEHLKKAKSVEVSPKDVELAVRLIIDYLIEALAEGKRIEIRGFGSFSLRHRPPRIGRNPKTGDPVPLKARQVPHFKAGKELRERVNASAKKL